MMSAHFCGQPTPGTFNSGSLGPVPSNSNRSNFRRPNLNESDSVSSNGGRLPVNPESEFTSLSRPDPKYADYSLKQKRVESYRNWPPSAKQKPENLVDAGFFYTGQADSVRCFLCGTGLRNWDPEDDPWVEHARWAPECFYVRENKGPEFINLVQIAVRQQEMQEALNSQTNEMAREATYMAYKRVPSNADTEPMDCDTNSALDGSTHNISPTPPRNQYEHLQQNYQHRLHTFYNFSNISIKNKEYLAKQGFCYIGDGKNDKIQCVFCGDILESWTKEDDITSVLNTHCSRNCSQIYSFDSVAAQSVLNMGYTENVVKLALDNLKQKGLDGSSALNTVNEILDMVECDQTDKNGNCCLAPKVEFDNARNKSEPEDLKEENRKLREASLCKICIDDKVSVVFLPCGHLCCCLMCAPSFRNCPMCRAEIKSTVRTYMS